MYLNTINNQFDNIMRGLPVNEGVFSNIIKVIRTPLIVEDKSRIPQWKFCTVKGEKRCTENIGSTDVLILDFDDPGYTYPEFEKRFQEYKYILHTSYSYNGTNSKFRVLLFLDGEYDINKLFFKCHDPAYSPYNYLLNFFPHVDPASFVKAQFFKMPAVKEKDSPYYYNIHDGKLFSPSIIEGFNMAYNMCEHKQAEYQKKIDIANAKARKDAGDLTKAKEYVQRKLEQLPNGMRHNGVFGIACWFKSIGGTYPEFCMIPKPSWADKTFEKQITRLRNEWYKLK